MPAKQFQGDIRKVNEEAIAEIMDRILSSQNNHKLFLNEEINIIFDKKSKELDQDLQTMLEKEKVVFVDDHLFNKTFEQLKRSKKTAESNVNGGKTETNAHNSSLSTYQISIEVLRKIALDRLCTTVPATIRY